MRRVSIVLPMLCALVACGKSPTGPSPGAAPNRLLGQTVSAVDGTAAPRLSVTIGGWRSVTTDQEGLFEIEVSPGTHDTTIRGSGYVERQTAVAGPGPERARLSLIPSAFDLTAFDEMFRTSGARLQRWISRPSLVVLGSVMAYRMGSGEEYQATGERLTDEEVQQMVAHLTEGLALLTGRTYEAFESVAVERPEAGAWASVARHGQIVVGRYTGIMALANTIGYGQWAETPSGAVTGGAMFLDRDFDRQDSRRRLLRIHELGHALGYLHVQTRTSIMNPAIGPEPTDFDRTAARIAFQRQPGNRAPDVDPSSSSPAFVTDGTSRVMPPVYCR